jgi:hypothetical protein
VGTTSEAIVAEPKTNSEGMAEWMKWGISALVSALTTTALGAWYMSATLTTINDHLDRLDSGEKAIMEQHAALSDQIYTINEEQNIVITLLHDEHTSRIPLPSPSKHDGFSDR